MLDIQEYLESKGCEVKPAGSGNVHTHCFMCGEDTSKPGRLYINVDESDDKEGLWFCFLCNAKGNFNHIRKFFGDAEVELSEDGLGANYDPIIEVATEYYVERLFENIEAYKFLVDERGLHDQTIVSARLGWADGGLANHLLKTFSPEEVQASGLVDRFGQDFFRDEIIIPYMQYGRAVALRGKKIDGKYRSAPGSQAMLYNSDSLFGEKTVMITEGEFKALHLQQLGFTAVGVPGVQTWKDEWEDYLDDMMRGYIIFDSDKPGKAGAEKLASKLGPRARIVELPKKNIDIEDWIVKYGKNREDVEYLLSKAKGGLLVSVREAYDRWTEIEGMGPNAGLRFNVNGLDSVMYHGLLPGQLATMIAKTGVGKELPHSTIICTPEGNRRFGDLEVGDLVFGSDGKPTQVLAIFEQGVTPTYRMTFSDGTSALSGAKHQWTVLYRHGKNREWTEKVMTTEELMQDSLRAGHEGREYKYRIPMIDPVQYPEQDLPIGPYTLGALIANGSLGQGSVYLTTPDAGVISRIRQEGYEPLDRTCGAGCERYILKGLTTPVKDLGLNVKSRDKFIPYQYLIGSVEQRFALLQGLMDGDGSNLSKTNSTHKVALAYHTTSRRLADDVVKLVNSFGGTGCVNVAERTYDSGEEYEDIRVSIMLPEEIRNRLFTDRKDSEFEFTNKHVPHRAIASIEPEGEEEQRCITVAAEDSLYSITENYILTHNTIMSINFFERMKLLQPDIKILYFSLEQSRNEWFERAYRIRNFYEPGSSLQDTIEYWENNFFLVDKPRINEAELLDAIYQFAYEVGEMPDLWCVDYLGYFAEGVSGNSEYERMTNAIHACKNAARETQTVGFAPTQSNRSGDFGKELEADQGRGAGTVEETSDLMLALWAPDQAAGITEDQKRGQVHQKILKSRNGGVGTFIPYQFAPLTLAMVPLDDPLYERALQERMYASAGDNWKQAVTRHKTGSMRL